MHAKTQRHQISNASPEFLLQGESNYALLPDDGCKMNKVAYGALTATIAALTILATTPVLPETPNPSQDGRSAQSTDGPTLEGTLDWLKDKLKVSARYSRCRLTESYSRLQGTDQGCELFESRTIDPQDFSGCVVSWVETHTTAHAQQMVTTTTKYSIPIYEKLVFYESDAVALDRDGGTGSGASTFGLRTLGNKYRMDSTRTGASNTDSGQRAVDAVFLHFGVAGEDNADMARRVFKAFVHANELCQSQKPKTAEPF